MSWHLAMSIFRMIVSVKVKPGVRKEGVAMENGTLAVRVAAPAVDGKANEALIRLLSEVLAVPKSRIVIRAGHSSRFKRIEMPDDAAKRLLELAKSD